MPAAKRLACVAPEVDLGECTLHSPLQKVNKAEPTPALKSKNPKQLYHWPPKKAMCPPKTFLKKEVKFVSPLSKYFSNCTIGELEIELGDHVFINNGDADDLDKAFIAHITELYDTGTVLLENTHF